MLLFPGFLSVIHDWLIHIFWKVNTSLNALFAIAHWLFNIYFYSVPTPFSYKNHFLELCKLCRKLLQSLTNKVWFLQSDIRFYILCIIFCPSDGTLNGAPCQGQNPPWHVKDRSTGFRWRVGCARDLFLSPRIPSQFSLSRKVSSKLLIPGIVILMLNNQIPA